MSLKNYYELLKEELQLENDSDYTQFNNSLGAIDGSFRFGSAKKQKIGKYYHQFVTELMGLVK